MAVAQDASDDGDERKRQAAWLSRGLESLVRDFADIVPPDTDDDAASAPRAQAAAPPHFDVVIVGSGYGGAVAAYELARIERERPKVCMLERGSEYLRGAFPSRLADLAGHVRFATPDRAVARGALEGLFDVRVGPDVNALVASGLGGGSLINAGVLEMPHPSIFREARWPAAIRTDGTLRKRARSLRKLLGAAPLGEATAKFEALESLRPQRFRPVRVSVAAANHANSGNAELDKCIGCGDCATGCNHNAKDSLDLNLLRIAREAEMRIYTGATVISLERSSGGGWVVAVNHTERHLRERQKRPFRLRASHVILAAGTFGSTEILMRSQTSTLRFSAQLGKKFSSNGDTIFVLHDTAAQVNGVARETDDPEKRKVGPTITGMIDLRTGDPQADVVIQDLGVPGSLRPLFEEAAATTDALNKLLVPDPARHAPDIAFDDPAAIDESKTERSMAVAMIGRDSADGVLERRNRKFDDCGDGVLTVRWPQLRHDPRFASYHDRLSKFLARSKRLHHAASSALQNPAWRPLSSELELVFGAQRGPMLTVHPLGGCPMGDTPSEGVVDDLGRVFDAASEGSKTPAFHAGLLVLDGSIVPTSLGINPSLTIAVLAQRAMAHWLQSLPTSDRPSALPTPQRRPVFALIRQQPTRPTEVEVTEQLCGRVRLRGDPKSSLGHGVELTLTYAPQQLARLRSVSAADRCLEVKARSGAAGDRSAEIAAGQGSLRLFALEPGPKAGEWVRGELELQVPVTGTLKIFRHGTSRPGWRAARAMVVWALNRGFRDAVQNLYDRLRRWLGVLPRLDEPEQRIPDYLKKLYRLADHAGSVRLLEYELTTGQVASDRNPAGLGGFTNARISAHKRLRYSVGANPWSQLQELTLTEFPNLDGREPKPKLALDLDFLVKKSVPLLRIVAQQDRPTALVDLVRFGLYLFRVVLQVHALSFRRPDPRTDREPRRLPGAIPGRLPSPEIEWRIADRRANGDPIWTRLTRYRDERHIAAAHTAGANPVLLIHGYSASGTTYAHPAVQGNIAETLCRAGRDVWIVDLRSSAGLPTATEGWAFEDMARADIPDAIGHILAVAGGSSGKIDVVAHCMGSAMFSMAVLGAGDDGLSRRIGRVVLSQIGPVMQLSTANVFRAYVMRWIRHFLPLADYSFRPVSKRLSLGGNLLDRILATLPYPRTEFRLENPLWPPGVALPWATSRHRMDALYARTFSLANMSAEVLDHIDDFFGPLSIETVSQVIHFARTNTVTDRSGFNAYVNPFRLQSRFRFPILYLHGADNGLSDAATLDRMRDALTGAGVVHREGRHLRTEAEVRAAIADRRRDVGDEAASLITWRIDDHGHQDPLIGTRAHHVSSVIERFLAPR